MKMYHSSCRLQQGFSCMASRVGTVAILLIVVVLTGCSTPIGTRPASIRHTYEHISRNAVKADDISDLSARVLHQFFIEELFREAPNKAITILHDIACKDNRRELLYTLSELTYLSAKKTGTSQKAADYYLASAIYAYYYLFNQGESDPPGIYDRRLRFACDLYNASLAQFLALQSKTGVELSGIRELPVGTITLEIRQDYFPYHLKNFDKFLPADGLSVYGLSVRDRISGLGAPFVAVEKQSADKPVIKSFPGTLFLRIEGGIEKLKSGAQGRMELYSSYEKRTVAVNGEAIPLEKDLSAQLAYNLNQPFVWELGRLQFLKGAIVKNGVYTVQPYVPGRIPVVFVHGTFSSPVWWAEMINTLRSDPVLWDTYQFWFYLYDSGKPILLSSNGLRHDLSKMIKAIDPQGKDKALNEMVIVGHSQGGLLTKLTAVETGESLIQSTTGKSMNELDLDDSEKAVVQKYLIYSPLPFVRRVIFISTPHRGSYLATGWVRNIVSKIISMPANLIKKSRALAHVAEDIGVAGAGKVGHLANSVDNMSPDNPGLLALAEIPLSPGIKGHSIIPIHGDEEPPDGDDGVVKYTSAHIEYVESEFIVRNTHSCQSHPLVIEEVRRILIEHLNRSEP